MTLMPEPLKSDINTLRDLTSLHSSLYPQLIEKVCDKLLEDADKFLDDVVPSQPQIIVRETDRKMMTNNNLLKPQHAWISLVDNSYQVFVPSLKTKPNSIEPLNAQITAA